MKLIRPPRFVPSLTRAAAFALLCLVPRAHAQLPNAWQITDSSTAASTRLYYTFGLSPGLQVAATNSTGGFHFTLNARMVSGLGGPRTMLFAYGLGDKRFIVWFDLDGAGDLTAELEDTTTYTLTTNGTGAAFYHTHEIIYDPATATASYLFDGQVKTTNWPASNFTLPAGLVQWGGSSQQGRGQMNFHSVSFEVTNSVVVTYDAGTSNNPAIAPDPTNSVPAWTLVKEGSTSLTSATNLSPDIVPLPTTPSVTTLAATSVDFSQATLGGVINQGNLAATVWFEWGTDTNYGSTTPPQALLSDTNNFNLSQTITGLAPGGIYHFRCVASNTLGVAYGQDADLTTVGAAPSATTLAATNLEPYQATLYGVINQGNLAATAWFQWGTSTNYGNATPAQALAIATNEFILSRTITGLAKGGTYHFRCVATNALGVAYGQDAVFTTPLSFSVTSLADSGPGSLRQRMSDAKSGDTITFGINGTITLTSGELLIPKHLTISGPGPAILAVSGNNDSRVFNIPNGVNASISGLKIRNGVTLPGARSESTNSAGGNALGGGGLFNRGTLSLSNCVITANTTGRGGNGFGGKPDFVDFGTAGGNGGDGAGIYNVNTLTLTSCTVSGNACGEGGDGGDGFLSGGPGGIGGKGGGICNVGLLTLTGCTLNDNDAGFGGTGGAGINDIHAATGGNGGIGGPGGTGGGLHSVGTAVLTGCTLSRNASGNGGRGGTGGAEFPVVNDWPGGNGGRGGDSGGIYNGGALSLTACTINGNYSGSGGWGGHSTLSLLGGDGGDGGDGGGVVNVAAASFATLQNTLIALNSQGFGGPGDGFGQYGTMGFGPDLDGAFTSAGHNLVGENYGTATFVLAPMATGDMIGTLFWPIDPLLGTLADHGGPTPTCPPLPGSPALDAGDDSLVNMIATDQRGYPRRSGAHLDIGAVEFQVVTTANAPVLTNPEMQANGSLTFGFTSSPDATYTVLASTNVASPLGQWLDLGPAAQNPPGVFQFTDAEATNYPMRFYRVSSP
jgi:hypothetical protein